MILHVAFLLQSAQQPPNRPLREVPDPGVIATDQRVTPAGVQSVFDGRVGGVKLGKTPGEICVAPVGRLPAHPASNLPPGAPPLPRAKSFIQLFTYSADATVRRAGSADDSAAVVATSVALGDFLAGATAAARTANSSGRRVAVVALPANDALAVLDAANGALIYTVPLGVLPVGR